MKFGVVILYRNVSNRHEFHENRCDVTCTLHEEVKVILPCFLYVCQIWIKLGVSGNNKNLLNNFEFPKFCHVKGVICLGT